MSRHDWLIDGDRGAAAAERIYAGAAELIYRDGYDVFSLEALATHVHCSRATIYRHAGGKSQIREQVTIRMAARIVTVVRAAVDGLSGAARVLTAVGVAVTEIRADPAGQLFVDTMRDGRGSTWLTGSPAVAAFAAELAGLDDDPAAARWIVRLVLSLLMWPGDDADAETALLQRFVAPAFD